VVRRDLCPCLDSLFGDAPAEEVLPQLAAQGFQRFEFWDWRRRDLDALRRSAGRAGLVPVIFSGNTFDEPLVDRGAHGWALAQLRRSLEVAGRLGVRLLTMHVGYALPERVRQEQWAAAVDGLRSAGELAGAAGVTLALEPLNSRVDHPGYFLDTLPDALRLLDEVSHPAVRLLLDVYHMGVMHTDLLELLPVALPMAAHVHVADVPGRGEPGSGTIPWPVLMRLLRDGGYRGPLGLECWPTGTVGEALRRSAEVLAA